VVKLLEFLEKNLIGIIKQEQ